MATVADPGRTDQAARDEIQTALDRTLFVEAGAGTGKTTALVGRIVQLVREGVPMRTIAAITFTEAAAAELRGRVREALEAAAVGEPSLASAAVEVDEAAISTLHAFAQRILSEHPLDAGLPPSFEVLDEIRSGLAFDERWDDVVDQLLGDDALATPILRGRAAGLSFDLLREAALVFDDHWDRLASVDLPLPPLSEVDATPVVDGLRRAVAMGGHCLDTDDGLAQHLGKMAQVADRLGAATSELEVLHLLDRAPQLTCSVGRAASWSCPIDDVRAELTAAQEARGQLMATVKTEVLAHLLDAVRLTTIDAARTRQAQGRLAFHDLLVLARDLVRDHREVRAALREQYRYLLIDEFQDTDPLQVELATMLAEAPSGQEIEPGRLFFVGDAMQSIYRFRRADIRLFSEVRASIDRRLHLTTNHRSVPGVLAWVNALFTELVGDGVDGAQPPYEPLMAARTGPAGRHPRAPVVLLGHQAERPIAAIREAEAAEIAETIDRVVHEEWATRHGPARLRDIAILLPTRTTLPQLELALDRADIAYRVESASLVWGTQEVRDLLAVLSAIDDPTDQVALVSALRSAAFGCGDDELLAFRQAGGRWDLRRDPPPPAPASVTSALAELRALHDQRWWMSVSTIVEKVLRELRFFELAFARPRPRDRWRRLRWVLDQARAFEEDGGGNLRQFVAWALRQADEDARVKESALPEADDDAVRILTIHGAKGLEFPVVILAGLNRPIQKSARKAQVYWDGDRPEVRTWKDFRTAGYDGVADAEQRLERHEQLRLLYVGATRAEDHLIVSVHHAKRGDSHAKMILGVAEQHPDLWRRLDPPDLVLRFPPHVSTPSADPDAPSRRRAWWADRQARIDGYRQVPVRAATAIASLGRLEVLDDDSDGDEELAHGRGRAGTAIGRAVHATLQSVDLSSGAGIDAMAAAQATAEGVGDSAAEVERLARAALASPSVRAAVAGRHWRELYVAAPVGAVTVEGFVDLLYETADGLVVVDYKTDAVRADAEIDAAVARYRLQAAAYALALETSLGRPVAGCRFVFVSGGHARERAVDDLPQAICEVRSLIA